MKQLFIDVKTTGLTPSLHALFEINAVVVIDSLIESEIFLQISPSLHSEYDSRAMQINGISRDEVAKFPSGDIQLAKFKDFLQDFLAITDKQDKFVLVAYNATFVKSFLEKFFTEYGQEPLYQYLKTHPIDLLFKAQQYFEDKAHVPYSWKREDVLLYLKLNTITGINQLVSLNNKLDKGLKTKPVQYIDLDQLNETQKYAVMYTQNPLLVLAGAGSGKTRVITYKIAYLVSSLGYMPEEILAVTFTNKAAKEMKERVVELVGKAVGRRLTVSTFHSLGLQILKEEYHCIGYTKEFSIFGGSEQEAILKDVLVELSYTVEDYPIAYIKSFISTKKNLLQTPQEIAETNTPQQDIYSLYEQKLKENNAFDFDDLIFKPLQVFYDNTEVKNKWAHQYKYLLVDEYQDTNHAQYQFMKVLSAGHNQICAVGDDDQSIYAFRGADVANILSFEKDFIGAQRVVLNYNYRNSEVILKAATAIINHNTERHQKEVLSGRTNHNSQKIFYFQAHEPEDEAQWIASEIFSNRIDRGVPYNHQAILCRTNSQMRAIEKVLRQESIRYHIIGGFSFFDRAEVKIIFSYLRLLYNPQDNQAFYRAINFPKKGVGEKSLEILSQFAQQKKIGLLKACSFISEIIGLSKTAILALEDFANQYWDIYNKLEQEPLSQVVYDMYTAFGIQDELYRVYKDEAPQRVNSLIDIQTDIAKKERRFRFQERDDEEQKYPLSLYLQETVLSQLKEEEVKEEDQKVLLITIHSAKGLEFQAVFIPGFQEGIFPHERSLKEEELGVQEERRLCYVAFTRAKDYLFLSSTEYRKIQGEDREQKPSRFLEEIPQKYLEIVDGTEEESINQEKYLEEMRKILQVNDGENL